MTRASHFLALAILLTVQACALPADYYTPVTTMPAKPSPFGAASGAEPAHQPSSVVEQPQEAAQQSGIEWFKNRNKVARTAAPPRPRDDGWGKILHEMVDASVPIAIHSDLCGYWDMEYWTVKIIGASVKKDVPGLAERFRLASLEELKRLQEDSSDRIPCGSGLRELSLMLLTDWSMAATR